MLHDLLGKVAKTGNGICAEWVEQWIEKSTAVAGTPGNRERDDEAEKRLRQLVKLLSLEVDVISYYTDRPDPNYQYGSVTDAYKCLLMSQPEIEVFASQTQKGLLVAHWSKLASMPLKGTIQDSHFAVFAGMLSETMLLGGTDTERADRASLLLAIHIVRIDEFLPTLVQNAELKAFENELTKVVQLIADNGSKSAAPAPKRRKVRGVASSDSAAALGFLLPVFTEGRIAQQFVQRASEAVEVESSDVQSSNIAQTLETEIRAFKDCLSAAVGTAVADVSGKCLDHHLFDKAKAVITAGQMAKVSLSKIPCSTGSRSRHAKMVAEAKQILDSAGAELMPHIQAVVKGIFLVDFAADSSSKSKPEERMAFAYNDIDFPNDLPQLRTLRDTHIRQLEQITTSMREFGWKITSDWTWIMQRILEFDSVAASIDLSKHTAETIDVLVAHVCDLLELSPLTWSSVKLCL